MAVGLNSVVCPSWTGPLTPWILLVKWNHNSHSPGLRWGPRLWRKCFANWQVRHSHKALEDFFIIALTLIMLYSPPGQPQSSIRTGKLELLSGLHFEVPWGSLKTHNSIEAHLLDPNLTKIERRWNFSSLPSAILFFPDLISSFVNFFPLKVTSHVNLNSLWRARKIGHTHEFVPNSIAS